MSSFFKNNSSSNCEIEEFQKLDKSTGDENSSFHKESYLQVIFVEDEKKATKLI